MLVKSWLRVVVGLFSCAALVAACGGGGAKDAAGAGGTSGMHTAGKGASAAGQGAGNGGSGAAGKGAAGSSSVQSGEPLKATDLTWTFIDFPDAHCRDGSMAGLALSLSTASKNVMIFLEGGGACFDSLTCSMNPSTISAAQKAEKTAGVLDRTNAENPVKDWSYVYIPYCTGDVHSGTKDDGSIMGVTGTQHFVGRLNMEAFLKRIVPTFTDAKQVLLTGVSAGGFGAAANAEMVRSAFGSIPVTMIDDSGPAMSAEYLPACLQDKWRTLWGFDDSILKDCGSDCPNHSDYDVDYSKHVAKKSGPALSGLIEANADSVITLFYGYGTNNCTGSFLTPVPAQTFTAGLLDFRSTMQAYPNFGTYYITSSQHTWLGGASFYSTTVGGTRMVDWFKHILDGTSAEHIGP